jgi:hypothetical protein
MIMNQKNENIQKEVKKEQKSSILLILFSVLSSLFVLNFLFLFFIQNENKTIKLLKSELRVLEQNQKIINSSREITATYSKEVELISEVFPNEETIPKFIGILENLIKGYADEYSFKFNAVAPVKEQEKFYLPLTITMKTDYQRLLLFLEKLETLPYMTHVTSIFSKNPDGFTNKSEIIIGLKLYVQNPFSSK